MTTYLECLQASVSRLRALVEPLDSAQLEQPAYPSEWSIADVLSHIGSGAEILHRRFDDTLAGQATPDDFAPSVWDRWNAKAPATQRADALVADRALAERVASIDQAQQAGFAFTMGPMTLDFSEFIGLRCNEHVLHTWDIEVTLDPSATLPDDAAAQLVDNLGMIIRFTGKPDAEAPPVTVQTSNPRRDLVLTLGPESVSLEPTDALDAPDLALPAEALVRLVYGRLDPAHTPQTHGAADLDGLRQVFPGP